MKIFFRTEDLKRLETIDEKQLYLLNCKLLEAVAEVKGHCMSDKQLICDLVSLAETAAKEIACRNRWSPIPSDGKYSTTGITYDTKEYRQWLRDNRDTTCYNVDFISQFSFWEDILSLMGA